VTDPSLPGSRAFPWRIWLVLLLVGVILSALIPPLQSPDEADHLERAALLSQGVVLLQTPAGKSSGGQIDSGLAAYLNSYQYLWYHGDQKVTSKIKSAAEALRWSEHMVFRPAPGTGFYFPGIYLPQALGLATGRIFGLTIDVSYRLARLFVLLTIVTLLLLAFGMTAPSPFVLSLLILPMTLFQCASATIDGLSVALVILALSMTLKAVRSKSISGRSIIIWSLILFILLTSRIQVFSLIFVMPYVYFLTRNIRVLPAFLAVGVASVIWVLIALHHTVDLRVTLPGTSSVLAWSYLEHPGSLWKIFSATFSDADLTTFYQQSFIGILGWLDTYFQDGFYTAMLILLAGLAVLSVSLRRDRAWAWLSVGLIVSALVSTLLIFFLLLVTWTPAGANTIQGVQGRYFILPALMVAYALHDSAAAVNTTLYKRLALTLLVLMGFLVAFTLPNLLIQRYTMM